MTDIQKNKIWAASCYIPPLFAFILFVQRKNHLAFFHAKQALGTWAVFVLGSAIFLLPGRLFAMVKWPVTLTLGGLFLFFLIMGLITAIRGQENSLPLIGEYIDGFTFQKLSRD